MMSDGEGAAELRNELEEKQQPEFSLFHSNIIYALSFTGSVDVGMRPRYDTPNKSDKSEILIFKASLPHQDFALCSLATSGCSLRERETSRGSRFLLLHFSSSTSSSGSTSTSQLKGGQGRKSDQPTGFLHEIYL